MKDYKHFSSVAKSRFKPMGDALGYTQISNTRFVKQRDGWYETFSLQASTYGNHFFYVNWGVILPDAFPASVDELKDKGRYISFRLRCGDEGAFPCATKQQIEESARQALEAFKKQAVPWFAMQSLDSIKKFHD